MEDSGEDAASTSTVTSSTASVGRDEDETYITTLEVNGDDSNEASADPEAPKATFKEAMKRRTAKVTTSKPNVSSMALAAAAASVINCPEDKGPPKRISQHQLTYPQVNKFRW